MNRALEALKAVFSDLGVPVLRKVDAVKNARAIAASVARSGGGRG